MPNFDPLKGAKSKIKKYVILGLLGFIGIFFILIIAIIVFSAAYAFADETVKEIGNFFNKLGNFITFNGWCTDSECTSVAMNDYYKELDKVNENYKSSGVEIDVDLITGTIFYDKYDYSIAPKSLATDDEGEGLTDEDKDFIAFYRKSKDYISKLASKMVSGTYLDFKQYKQYLIDDYIPDNYSDLLDGMNDETKKYEIEKIADQMMASASKKDQSDLAEMTCTSNLSNIKVKLYYGGPTGDEKYYQQTVSFDDYVKGVILAEEGGVVTNKANEEFVRAFILAAKSYTLSRGVRYMNPSYFDLNSPVIEIELQNSSDDQNYKSYTNATSGQKEVIERLYTEMSNQILVTNSDSTRVKQAGYMNNDPRACGSHDCSEGNGSTMNVTEAAKLSQQGYTYDKILTYYYGSRYAIKNIDNDCSSTNTGIVSGEFTNWTQYGNNSWSQIQIGCGTVHHCGCLATSVAIQIANAANNGGLKLKVDKFDPYVFITTLKQNGGFSSGGSFQWKGWNSITDNWYCDGGSFIYGSVAERAAELKRKMNDGWYPIVNVKYGGCGEHYVAIIAVNGSTITMADPASTQTNLSNSSKYPCFVNGKTSRVRYCKVK